MVGINEKGYGKPYREKMEQKFWHRSPG